MPSGRQYFSKRVICCKLQKYHKLFSTISTKISMNILFHKNIDYIISRFLCSRIDRCLKIFWEYWTIIHKKSTLTLHPQTRHTQALASTCAQFRKAQNLKSGILCFLASCGQNPYLEVWQWPCLEFVRRMVVLKWNQPVHYTHFYNITLICFILYFKFKRTVTLRNVFILCPPPLFIHSWVIFSNQT